MIRNSFIFTILLFIGIITGCGSSNGNEIPLPDKKSKKIGYDTACIYRNDYLNDSKKLVFLGGKNSGMPVEGFRISKQMIDDLFAQDSLANELYVFFGKGTDICLNKDGKQILDEKGEPVKDFTLIFSVLKPCTPSDSCNGYDGEVCKGLLFDYVDPCPTKCPKFK